MLIYQKIWKKKHIRLISFARNQSAFFIRKARIVIPGFDGIPLYNVLKYFVEGLTKGYITNRAASLSFSFFLALFPAILFFFTLIPYIPVPHLQDNLMTMLEDAMPPNTFEVARSTLDDIINRPQGGLVSIGFILALYFATNGVSGIIDAFDQSYHSVAQRKGFNQRVVSIYLVVILSFTIILAITFWIGGKIIILFFTSKGILSGLQVVLLEAARWTTLALMSFFSLSFLYYLGPAKKQRYRFFSPGSILATFLFLLASIGFDYYVTNFAQYNALYGSIGTLIIVLMWIYFNALILLVGFELNVSISKAKRGIITVNKYGKGKQ